MRLKPLRLPDSGPLLGAGYLLLWLLLWLTVQPYWMLPYGLRFGALLLVPVRYWGWLLGGELVATAGIGLAHGLPRGWLGFAIDELPEPLVMAGGLWLLRRFNLHASLHSPQEVTRLLLSVVLVVTATTAVDAALLALVSTPGPPELIIGVLGEELLSHYLGILLIVPLMVMLLRARIERRALASLFMDGLLVMLPSMTILLLLSEQAAPQPQFARVLSLAPVLFFAFRHGWRGASLAMLITSLGMTLVDQ
ncbi:MAG TPA: MASE1 domain-containing protein, partial [Rhodanobacter sp.]|nr:MASE1 domain-containing protein [Rhodanobacter sp.]